jgi:hypothetical protein
MISIHVIHFFLCLPCLHISNAIFTICTKRPPYDFPNIYTSPPSPLKKPSWPEALEPSLIILSASPTCFRSVISRECRSLRFICFLHRIVNPWGSGLEDPDIPLMTAGCYWRGSEELESLLRCRYTSVPYLRCHISFHRF